MNEKKPYAAKKYLTSSEYITDCLFTLFIFFLGFKWTLLGIFWIPSQINPFMFLFFVIAWIYYNYIWLRTALYLPGTIMFVRHVYAQLGIKMPWHRCFYIALCKANKIRKEDITIKRQNSFIDVLAGTFTKPAVIVNFKRGEAHQISKAIFIHSHHKVFDLYKFLAPYFTPTFIVLLILTPFMPAYNYPFLAERLSSTPDLMSFSMYIAILPFKFLWVFKMLSLLAANLISPLVVLPADDIFASYVKETNLKINFAKVNTLSFDAVMAFVMTLISLVFYIFILGNILL